MGSSPPYHLPHFLCVRKILSSKFVTYLQCRAAHASFSKIFSTRYAPPATTNVLSAMLRSHLSTVAFRIQIHPGTTLHSHLTGPPSSEQCHRSLTGSIRPWSRTTKQSSLQQLMPLAAMRGGQIEIKRTAEKTTTTKYIFGCHDITTDTIILTYNQWM